MSGGGSFLHGFCFLCLPGFFLVEPDPCFAGTGGTFISPSGEEGKGAGGGKAAGASPVGAEDVSVERKRHWRRVCT